MSLKAHNWLIDTNYKGTIVYPGKEPPSDKLLYLYKAHFGIFLPPECMTAPRVQ